MKLKKILFIIVIVGHQLSIMANSNIQTPPPPPMSGTFTIGGSTPDYATFNDAVTALSSNGINGSVVFNVRPGTYNERVSIPSITGSSAANTITFQAENGDSSSVILTQVSSATIANNYTLQLNGCNYVIFNQLSISRTGANTYSVVVEIANMSNNNSFLNNHIFGVSAPSTATYKTVIYSTTAIHNNNLYSNNFIENGSNGIWLSGQTSTQLESGNIIENNVLSNQYHYAIYLMYQDAPSVTSNTIDKGDYGIYASYCDNGLRFLKNKISLVNPATNGAGIYLYYCDANSNNGLVGNNFITVGGSNIVSCIYINLSTSQNIYYNSTNCINTNATSKAFWVAGLTTQNLDVRDNIFSNNSIGYAYYVDQNSITSLSLSNYNDLFTNGINLGYWGTVGGNQTNLTNWKATTSKDANSISLDPQYNTMTDLHTLSVNVNGMGTSLTSSLTPVSDDIDNQIRNALTPDIGADEFSLDNLGISIINMPNPLCEGTNSHIQVTIHNYGASTFTGNIPVWYQIDANPAVNETVIGATIISGGNSTYNFTALELFSIAGNYTISAGTNISTDINTSNDDLLNFAFTVNTLPNVTIVGPSIVSACNGDSIGFTATNAVGYSWNVGGSSANVNVLVNNTMLVIVTGTDAIGCSNKDTVTINGVTLPKPAAGFTSSINNFTVTFADTSHDATSWNWNFGDGNTSILQNPANTYSTSNSYHVVLIASNVCDSDTFEIDINVVGIEERLLEQSTEVYPNPATDNFTIHFINQSLQPRFIKLTNSIGQCAFVTTVDKKNPNNLSYDISSLTHGVYVLEIKFDQGILHKKIMIE